MFTCMLIAPRSSLTVWRMVVAVSALAIAGCSSTLGLEQPVREQPDASVQPDSEPDAADAAPTCPTAPAGCALFRCGATTSCYYACSGRTNWVAAESYCGQMAGATLATIEGTAEQDCVTAATVPTGSDSVWTGLYQLDAAAEPDQGWTWASGDSSAWRKWANFEPSDWAGDRDCADMGANGDWKADVCSYNRRFACKVEPR